MFSGMQTFVGILVESPKGIDLVVSAVSYRGIYQARRDLALAFLDGRAIVDAGPTASRSWTGRHEVGILDVLITTSARRR